MYIFALLTIAATVILSQLLIQFNLKNQLSDSRIINTSGKQRMLSQKLVKEILILNYLEELSYKEIADVLQIPLGTVSIRIRRAKIALKQAYTKLHLHYE